jgi:hypothetical protein
VTAGCSQDDIPFLGQFGFDHPEHGLVLYVFLTDLLHVLVQNFPDFLVKVVLFLKVFRDQVADAFDDPSPVLEDDFAFFSQVSDNDEGHVFNLILIQPHNFPKIQQAGPKFKDGLKKGSGMGFVSPLVSPARKLAPHPPSLFSPFSRETVPAQSSTGFLTHALRLE